MLSKAEKDYLIDLLEKDMPFPSEFRERLFGDVSGPPTMSYTGKLSKEALLANQDGSFPASLHPEKYFDTPPHAVPDDGWYNLLVSGDNLPFLKTLCQNKDPLIKNKIKGKVKLIYIDPPFATDDDFTSNQGIGAYGDHKTGSEFLEFLRRRLILAKELLCNDGSVFVHLDAKMSHYAKIILDEVFGQDHLQNEIIWNYKTYQGKAKKYYPRKHDCIFWYYNKIRPKFSLAYDDNYEDTVDAIRWQRYLVNGNQILGSHYPRSDSRFQSYYNRYVKEHGKAPRKNDVIMTVKGYVIDDVWTDIRAVDPKDLSERVGYPTQKPEQLLRRIIEAVTDKGDIVMDFFSGSGTTIATAEKLGRRWIACDLGKLASFTAQKRLLTLEHSKSLTAPGEKHGVPAGAFLLCTLDTSGETADTPDESLRFSLNHPPAVTSTVRACSDTVHITVTGFTPGEHGGKNRIDVPQIAAVWIDRRYNGREFHVTDMVFAQNCPLEIRLKRALCGEQLMAAYTDIFGNEFREILTLST